MVHRCKGEDYVMLDESAVEHRRAVLCDRFTPDELIELLGVSVEEVFERFRDECLELSWEDIYQ